MKSRFLAFWLSGLLAINLSACSDPSANALTAPEAAAPPMDVSVTELVAAYDKNEAAAQITYGNRMLRVTGMVEKINLGPDDEPFVNLAGGQLLPAQLHFGNGFAAQAAQLEKGRQYAFLCTNVSEILGSPMLKDCQLAD